ncbi:hypothetical protein QBC46DRAFT_371103 [Diplogelasinospora grovesii]|uniref:Nuclear transport factor 2 n=1 Tax=Diplogelasinospora grovesii TaxID=303347 RepID=A0AAN6NIU5_9PEZI|nr:hypothetical protein QBC46DRAFT_371103 [Diplogelasinospora grovesii]
MADIQAFATQFTQEYYSTFDGNRADLAKFYRPASMLTFESDQVLGVENIVAKLVGLPFQTVKHAVSTCDVQPNNNNGALILVTGQLITDGESNPLNFTQVFQIFSDGTGPFVFNDLFKLVY